MFHKRMRKKENVEEFYSPEDIEELKGRLYICESFFVFKKKKMYYLKADGYLIPYLDWYDWAVIIKFVTFSFWPLILAPAIMKTRGYIPSFRMFAIGYSILGVIAISIPVVMFSLAYLKASSKYLKERS